MERKGMARWVWGDLHLEPKTIGLYIAVALIVAVIAYTMYV